MMVFVRKFVDAAATAMMLLFAFAGALMLWRDQFALQEEGIVRIMVTLFLYTAFRMAKSAFDED